MKPIRVLLCVAVCAVFVAGMESTGAAAGPADLDDPGFDALEASIQPGAASLKARKAEMVARVRNAMKPSMKKAKKPKTVVVDCDKGESLQEAIDENKDPLVVEVNGLCHEYVQIRDRYGLILRGGDPADDGIRVEMADPERSAALEVWHSGQFASPVRIENLSISDSPGLGLGVWYSKVILENCRFERNGSSGVHVSVVSNVVGLDLIISDNNNGLTVQRESTCWCIGCKVEDNTNWAARADDGGALSLWHSMATGLNGIRAGSYSSADIDCVTDPGIIGYAGYSDYPCSLNVSQVALFAYSFSHAALFGSGEFSGRVRASDHGSVWFYGARQLSTGYNPIHRFSTLVVEPYIDDANFAHESQLTGNTHITEFSLALLLSETVVDGSLTCSSAGDAWADPGVSVENGSITGCEHYE